MNTSRNHYDDELNILGIGQKTVVTGLFLLAGLGVGAVAAILFAPKASRKAHRSLASEIEHSLKSRRDALEPEFRHLQKEFGEMRQKVDEYLSELR